MRGPVWFVCSQFYIPGVTEGIPSPISSGKEKIDLFLGEQLGMLMDRDFYRVQGMAGETAKVQHSGQSPQLNNQGEKWVGTPFSEMIERHLRNTQQFLAIWEIISCPKPSLEAGTQLEGKELLMSTWNFCSRLATLNFLYLETHSSCLCPKKSGSYNLNFPAKIRRREIHLKCCPTKNPITCYLKEYLECLMVSQTWRKTCVPERKPFFLQGYNWV